MPVDYDVIIVGGGFAGVTTARELRRTGARCLLIEARDRLGGRTFYSQFAGLPVEMGGTWIHWTQPYVWAEVMRYGLDLVESPSADEAILLSARRRTTGGPDLLDSLLTTVGRVLQVAQRMVRPYERTWYEGFEDIDSLSVQQAIDQAELGEEEADLVGAILSSLASASPSEAGVLDLAHLYSLTNCNTAAFFDALGRFKFRAGTQSLIDAMIVDASPEVMLSTPAMKIRRTDGEIEVTVRDGRSFSGRVGVIAVPVNTLKDIEFSPSLLPGKMAASTERHAGHGIKSWSLVSGVERKNYFGVGQAHGLTWIQTEYHTQEGALMVGFGPSKETLDPTNVGAVEKAVRAFLPNARVEAIAGHDWLSDPYSQGVWYIPRPGQITRYMRELQQPEGRLIFCGSDTASGWCGGIDGAVETGLRAGREVSRLLTI